MKEIRGMNGKRRKCHYFNSYCYCWDVAFLVYEAVSNAFHIVLTCTMTDELERTWKKAAVP